MNTTHEYVGYFQHTETGNEVSRLMTAKQVLEAVNHCSIFCSPEFFFMYAEPIDPNFDPIRNIDTRDLPF